MVSSSSSQRRMCAMGAAQPTSSAPSQPATPEVSQHRPRPRVSAPFQRGHPQLSSFLAAAGLPLCPALSNLPKGYRQNKRCPVTRAIGHGIFRCIGRRGSPPAASPPTTWISRGIDPGAERRRRVMKTMPSATVRSALECDDCAWQRIDGALGCRRRPPRMLDSRTPSPPSNL
jgi:hypothetical protein